eukprot:TRINITY_DN15531_c0_g2_i1.p1 TRINITY_DN15531_c0_g2~~TRINITY_DN15531_c0_g2_i1.p1  ORF type:complete len:530 (-),score=98.31 TRINITY_DN15531_c0_g2_i1:121-1653(-)
MATEAWTLLGKWKIPALLVNLWLVSRALADVDSCALSTPSEVDFRDVGPADMKEDAKQALQEAQLDEDAIKDFQAPLSQDWENLPKKDKHEISRQVAWYALRREFLRRHEWTIKGFDIAETDVNTSSAQDGWTPSKIGLRQLSILAVAVRMLVRKEVEARLAAVYGALEIPFGSSVSSVSKERALEILKIYTIVYMLGGAVKLRKPVSLEQVKRAFEKEYSIWPRAEQFVELVARGHFDSLPDDARIEAGSTLEVAIAIGEKYGEFDSDECRELKTQLVSMGAGGSVSLKDFRQKHDFGDWKLTEDEDELQDIGAVEDAQGDKPAGIFIPNYVASKTNCIDSSRFYTHCCRTECANWMTLFQDGHKDPADVIPAKNLSEEVMDGFKALKRDEHGAVDVRSLAFVQWMHLAFPTECPEYKYMQCEMLFYLSGKGKDKFNNYDSTAVDAVNMQLRQGKMDKIVARLADKDRMYYLDFNEKTQLQIDENEKPVKDEQGHRHMRSIECLQKSIY